MVSISLAVSIVSMVWELSSDDTEFVGWSLRKKGTRIRYITTTLFRMMDVCGTLSMYAFVWFFVSGFAATAVVGTRFLLGFLVYFWISYSIQKKTVKSAPLVK